MVRQRRMVPRYHPSSPARRSSTAAKRKSRPKGSRWGGTAPPFFPDLSELSKRANGRRPSRTTSLRPGGSGATSRPCATGLPPSLRLSVPMRFCYRDPALRESREEPLLLPFLAFAFLGYGVGHCNNPRCRCQGRLANLVGEPRERANRRGSGYPLPLLLGSDARGQGASGF